jgi:hypothetical protein
MLSARNGTAGTRAGRTLFNAAKGINGCGEDSVFRSQSGV